MLAWFHRMCWRQRCFCAVILETVRLEKASPLRRLRILLFFSSSAFPQQILPLTASTDPWEEPPRPSPRWLAAPRASRGSAGTPGGHGAAAAVLCRAAARGNPVRRVAMLNPPAWGSAGCACPCLCLWTSGHPSELQSVLKASNSLEFGRSWRWARFNHKMPATDTKIWCIEDKTQC